MYCNNNDLFTAERLAMMSSLFDVLQQSFEGTLNTVKINSCIQYNNNYYNTSMQQCKPIMS